MAVPAACVSIESQLKIKRSELTRLQNQPTGGDGDGPVVKPGQNKDPELEAAKKKLQAEIRALQNKLDQCVLQNTPVPAVTVRFESLFCGDQNDTEPIIDTEDDEPYLLVYALHIPDPVRALINSKKLNLGSFVPDARLFRIGPFSSVDSGDTVRAAVNVWDPNGRAQKITDPDNVFLFVAMMEEDATGAASVQTLVQTLMVPVVVSNILGLATSRAGFAQRIIEGLAGSIQTAVKPAKGSEDDRIGAIQQISVTQQMLDKVRTQGPQPINLSFTNSDTRYSARFVLTAA